MSRARTMVLWTYFQCTLWLKYRFLCCWLLYLLIDYESYKLIMTCCKLLHPIAELIITVYLGKKHVIWSQEKHSYQKWIHFISQLQNSLFANQRDPRRPSTLLKNIRAGWLLEFYYGFLVSFDIYVKRKIEP